MFTVYKEVENKLVNTNYEDDALNEVEKGSWIHVSNPTQENLTKISELTGISSEFLLCALDEEESARTDRENNDSLIVLDTPYITKQEEENEVPNFSTIPFVIAFNEDYYVTICIKDSPLIEELFKKVKVIEPHKHVRMTLNFISRLAALYITYLKVINTRMAAIQKKLRGSYKNKELIELTELVNTLVYFSTALSADKAVLTKLTKSRVYNKYEEDEDLMDDTQVELDQAIEMCKVYMDVSSNLMDSQASVINNNMNLTMRILTIVSIIISIPTLVTSIYGMNVSDMPFADSEYGFWIVLVIALAVTVVCTVILLLVFNIRNKNK